MLCNDNHKQCERILNNATGTAKKYYCCGQLDQVPLFGISLDTEVCRLSYKLLWRNWTKRRMKEQRGRKKVVPRASMGYARLLKLIFDLSLTGAFWEGKS